MRVEIQYKGVRSIDQTIHVSFDEFFFCLMDIPTHGKSPITRTPEALIPPHLPRPIQSSVCFSPAQRTNRCDKSYAVPVARRLELQSTLHIHNHGLADRFSAWVARLESMLPCRHAEAGIILSVRLTGLFVVIVWWDTARQDETAVEHAVQHCNSLQQRVFMPFLEI